MCLTVTHVPKSSGHTNCIPCNKVLERRFSARDQSHVFNTPYQCSQVPKNGILTPFFKNREKVHMHDQLGWGYIHAWQEELLSQLRKDEWPPRCIEKAYAFGVKAYGDVDLVCTMLYMPNIDLEQKSLKRKRAIAKWMANDAYPTDEEVRKIFPMFNP